LGWYEYIKDSIKYVYIVVVINDWVILSLKFIRLSSDILCMLNKKR
jgi:hypothetical protein